MVERRGRIDNGGRDLEVCTTYHSQDSTAKKYKIPKKKPLQQQTISTNLPKQGREKPLKPWWPQVSEPAALTPHQRGDIARRLQGLEEEQSSLVTKQTRRRHGNQWNPSHYYKLQRDIKRLSDRLGLQGRSIPSSASI